VSRSRALLLLGVLGVLAAGAVLFARRSGHAQTSDPTAAHLAVDWRGTFRGRLTLPARINWCPVTRVGLLEAISGDSGLAIVLYEREALTGAPHPVTSPDLAGAAQRPAATVALRWLRIAADTQLALFRSQGGVVHLQFRDGKASGDVTARMQALTTTDTLVVHGVFKEVPVVTTAVGCT